jgi:hypothetical protein
MYLEISHKRYGMDARIGRAGVEGEIRHEWFIDVCWCFLNAQFLAFCLLRVVMYRFKLLALLHILLHWLHY